MLSENIAFDSHSLPMPVEGIKWTGTEWQTKWPGISNRVVNGNLRLESNRMWAEKNYLLPIPTQQIALNPNLIQNPNW